MLPIAPHFPAVMVLREKGEILFLDRKASELTGYGAGEVGHLGELLARVFPEGQDQANALRLFRRAAAAAGRRGSARFHAEFHAKNGHFRRTTVQVQRWGGDPGDRSYLVSLLPSESRGSAPAGVMHGVARRVVRLLNSAVACSRGLAEKGDPAEERIAVLTALIERAQGLLGSLEAQTQGGSQGDVEGRR